MTDVPKRPVPRFPLDNLGTASKPGTWSGSNPICFMSMVSSGGLLYGRTLQGILCSHGGTWLSVPSDLFIWGLASGGSTPSSPLYALGYNYLYASFDGCRSWVQRPLPAGYEVALPSAIVGAPDAPHCLYLLGGNSGQYTLHASHDDGATWEAPIPVGAAHGVLYGSIRHPLLAVRD
jgi:hypothetical protein